MLKPLGTGEAVRRGSIRCTSCSPMGSNICRFVVFIDAPNMADAPKPEMSVAESSTPEAATVPVAAVPVPAAEGFVPAAEGSVPAGEADKTGVTSPPPALTPATPDKQEEKAPSPQDVGASDPDDLECVEIEEKQPAKKQKPHRELRSLSTQLSSTMSSLDTATKAMNDMVVLFQQHSSEVSQVATQLGFSGISHKYFLAAITAYQDEMKQCR